MTIMSAVLFEDTGEGLEPKAMVQTSTTSPQGMECLLDEVAFMDALALVSEGRSAYGVYDFDVNQDAAMSLALIHMENFHA